MFCTKCGKEVPENGECPCEQPQPQQPPQQQPQPQQQQPQQVLQQPWQQYQPAPSGFNRPFSSTPAINALKQAGSSPLFAAAAVLYSLLLIFSLVQIFIPTNIMQQVTSIFNEAGLYDEIPSEARNMMNTITGGISAGTIIVNLIALITPILIGIGMWIHFAASRDKSHDGMRTGGLTMIKVSVIIELVFKILLIFLILVVLIMMLIIMSAAGSAANNLSNSFSESFGGYSYSSPSSSSSAGIILIIVGIIYFVIFAASALMVILYSVKVLASIKAVEKCIMTGEPRYKVSAYVIVMNFIIAIFELIATFFLLIGAAFIPYGIGASLLGPGIFTYFLNAVILILISVAMIIYNSKIQQLYYSLNQNQYRQQQNPYNQYPNSY